MMLGAGSEGAAFAHPAPPYHLKIPRSEAREALIGLTQDLQARSSTPGIDSTAAISRLIRSYRTETSGAGTIAFREFPGRDHLIAGEEGWEEVATAALDWALDPQPTAIA